MLTRACPIIIYCFMFLIYFYTLICKNFIKRRIQYKLFLTFLCINRIIKQKINYFNSFILYFMLKRWNIKIYNIDFLIAILDYVLTFIDLDLKFKRKSQKRI